MLLPSPYPPSKGKDLFFANFKADNPQICLHCGKPTPFLFRSRTPFSFRNKREVLMLLLETTTEKAAVSSRSIYKSEKSSCST